jgi:hypothetical protein
MSDELLGVLIGGLLATIGGITGSWINNWLTARREERQRVQQRAKELLEGARKQMFGSNRVLRARKSITSRIGQTGPGFDRGRIV